MNKLSTRSVAIFAISLAFGSTLPFAANASLNAVVVGDVVRGTDGTRVRLHPSFTTQDRVDYRRAIDIYNVHLQEGKTGLIKPDINSRATIDFYLNNPGTGKIRGEPVQVEPLSTTDYVKPEEDVVFIDTLTQLERAALSRSEKVGKCWSYPGFSKSYYELCKKFIKGKTVRNTRGVQTDLIYTRTTGRSYLSVSSSSRATRALAPTYYERSPDIRAIPRNVRGASSSR